MRRVLFLSIVICIAASVAIAQDPVKVDSKHYSVMFENEKVRVLKIKYNSKEKSVMHDHPVGVVVYLNDSKVKFNLPDGRTIDAGGKPGEVGLAEAGKHLPENVGNGAIEAVLVELKGMPEKSSNTVALDAVKVDPEHHKIELENDRVRVLRIKFKPHEKLKEHEHPDGVAIFLTDVKSKFTLADGKTRDGGGKRGEATWAAAERHVIQNVSDRATEVILVELK